MERHVKISDIITTKSLEQITAIAPGYDEHGKITTIYTKEGAPRTLQRNLKTVIKRLTAHYAKDIRELRRQSHNLTGILYGSILAISPGLVLMPFKALNPRIPKDPALALLNVAHDFSLCSAASNLTVKLAGGEALPLLWSLKTTERHIRLATAMFLWIHATSQRDLQLGRRKIELLTK